jgi:hypothetical protein
MKDFSAKNSANFGTQMLNALTIGELFKPGMLNTNQTGGGFFDFNNLFNSNPFILSTLESFKNFSRNFSNNMNYSTFNNVKYFLFKI